ncbi:hypothetical protein GLP24_04880 [Photobacterium carnosum]|uniref:type II toxin-antitoxin system YafO family toxin n=1 Tax=Photobacterium carnosum TaxID=2023717 RepID=UPI001E4CB7F5|nr:type II toxin-antitoxin system YafO family toxin [Photobacterium carnosum]MCD9544184.1 hypothetical protein [Photobacterium carnosum]
MIKVVVIHDLCDDCYLSPPEQFIVEQFKLYKELSIQQNPNDNFAAPNEESTQRQEPSLHSFFGRDRIFDFPKDLLAKIWIDNLAHIHIDTDAEWSEPPKVQWYTTSKNALIYSAFKYTDKKDDINELVFVVHEILSDFDPEDESGAHKYYKRSYIEELLVLAEWHRENYPNNQGCFV